MNVDIVTAVLATLFLLWLGGIGPAFTFALLAILIGVTHHYSKPEKKP